MNDLPGGLPHRADLLAWRRAKRTELLAARTDMVLEAHHALSDLVLTRLLSEFDVVQTGRVGLYWPYRREINCLPLVDNIISAGGTVLLPVVVEKNRPLEFRAWRPGEPLLRGAYDILYPEKGPTVQPDTVIAPLVGFNAAGFRLGYGGGYYDRTLAAMVTPPLTIGIGFEMMRLDAFQPLPHDIPLHFLITEDGVFRGAGRDLPPKDHPAAAHWTP